MSQESEKKKYYVQKGQNLSGEFVGNNTYTEGQAVQLEPKYAKFYVNNGVLGENPPDAETPSAAVEPLSPTTETSTPSVINPPAVEQKEEADRQQNSRRRSNA